MVDAKGLNDRRCYRPLSPSEAVGGFLRRDGRTGEGGRFEGEFRIGRISTFAQQVSVDMGNWYTNITLRGPSQSGVVDFLNEHRISAYVSPTLGADTVIFDRDGDGDYRDPEIVAELAQALSKSLNCHALAVSVFDDDALWFRLYFREESIAEYLSASGDLSGTVRLCSAFGRSALVPLVWATLRVPRLLMLFESWRHLILVTMLGLPVWAVALGYKYIDSGGVNDVHDDLHVQKTPHRGA